MIGLYLTGDIKAGFQRQVNFQKNEMRLKGVHLFYPFFSIGSLLNIHRPKPVNQNFF